MAAGLDGGFAAEPRERELANLELPLGAAFGPAGDFIQGAEAADADAARRIHLAEGDARRGGTGHAEVSPQRPGEARPPQPYSPKPSLRSS